jgi:sugar phosphate isomerase/epimerase
LQIDPDGFFHLTYCTNIHPADGWPAVFANVRRFGPALKARLSPARPFGLGLRLSARDARELLDGDSLEEFQSFLQAEGLYVAIINGFPYGPFHGTAVKADVYAPDWRHDERVQYTLNLIEILSQLLPDGLDGGISTAPLSYKAWMRGTGDADWTSITHNVARVAERLVRLREAEGTFIHLDIEPEPDCLIETTDEAIDFFERWLLPEGGRHLAAALGMPEDLAQQTLRDHIRLCFDCCHAAVEYEDPSAALGRLSAAGIQLGRIQLSSALRVAFPEDRTETSRLRDRLEAFADSTYLHQVIEHRDGERRQFPDLPDALLERPPAGREWRIHFHVPLFTNEYEGLRSTQDYVVEVLRAARAGRTPRHLEIETYTWDVLPPGLKQDLLESIGREYDWVLEAFRR